MSDFKDCEYRYIGNKDKLYCKNKNGMNNYCDNCRENVHLNCDNYVPANDMCLRWFELGVSEISGYDECAEKTIYNDKDHQRKWSN